MIFVTADLHLFHENILQYCCRPFKNIEEMNKLILNNINAVVRPEDTLYILGDFVVGCKNKLQVISDTLKKIDCQNVHLVRGNHDPHHINPEKDSIILTELKKLFKSVNDIVYLKYNRYFFVLCHYALATWNYQKDGGINLFGHSHNNFNHLVKGRQMDVGVDCHKFKPISLDDIIEKMKDIEIVQVDHHNCDTECRKLTKADVI